MIKGCYWVAWQDGSYGVQYWTGKDWTPHRSEAKKYWSEPNNFNRHVGG